MTRVAHLPSAVKAKGSNLKLGASLCLLVGTQLEGLAALDGHQSLGLALCALLKHSGESLQVSRQEHSQELPQAGRSTVPDMQSNPAHCGAKLRTQKVRATKAP